MILIWTFLIQPRPVAPPAGPCPPAHSPSSPSSFLFLWVQLLTLIPNCCCHFCLAAVSDSSTGVCHKNPLFPFFLSSTHGADGRWNAIWGIYGTWFFLSSAPVATLFPSLSCFAANNAHRVWRRKDNVWLKQLLIFIYIYHTFRSITWMIFRFMHQII